MAGRKIIFNLPAGSGKTTTIVNELRETSDSTVCITFTNVAKIELESKFANPNVHVETIHSFFNYCTKLLFLSSDAVTFFKNHFITEITKKKSELTYKDIPKDEKLKLLKSFENLSEIKYTNSNYSSLLRGFLSHDDFIFFSCAFFNEHKKYRDLISWKFKTIYIDEYQDTHDCVIDLFEKICDEGNLNLKLYGDPMQKIYKNFKADLYNRFSKFENPNLDITNYRSNSTIVDVLNKIYAIDIRNENIQQNPKLHFNNLKPKISFKKSFSSSIADGYKLLTTNKEFFDNNGLDLVYKFYKNFKDKDGNAVYHYNSNSSAEDILKNKSPGDNVDPLLNYLFTICYALECIENDNIAILTSYIKETKKKNITITEIKELVKTLNRVMNDEINIENLVEDSSLLDLFNFSDSVSYKELYEIKFKIFKEYYSNDISGTQHSSKGTGIKKLNLQLTSNLKLSLDYEYLFSVLAQGEFNSQINKLYEAKKLSVYSEIIKINSNTKKVEYMAIIKKMPCDEVSKLKEILNTLAENNKYDNMSNWKNSIKLLKNIEIMENTYRHFYMCCSRAIEELTLQLPIEYIKFVDYLEQIGFEVEE